MKFSNNQEYWRISVYFIIIIHPFFFYYFFTVCWAPEVFEACPCNILHFFNVRWIYILFSEFLFIFFCVCCWVETESNTVGGVTTCTHAQYILDVSLIHAALWRPGVIALFLIIVHLLSHMWMISYVHPSIALHPKPRVTLLSLAHSCTLYGWCHALYAFPEVCRSLWLCLVVLVKAWGVLDWRHRFPANNCCLNVENSHNNFCSQC